MAFKVGRCLLPERLQDIDMTQQELADKIHMKRQQISDYANNRITMSLRNARNIADALDCNIEDLYEWIPVKASERKRSR